MDHTELYPSGNVVLAKGEFIREPWQGKKTQDITLKIWNDGIVHNLLTVVSVHIILNFEKLKIRYSVLTLLSPCFKEKYALTSFLGYAEIFFWRGFYKNSPLQKSNRLFKYVYGVGVCISYVYGAHIHTCILRYSRLLWYLLRVVIVIKCNTIK